jgi:hypothetical protein
MAIKFNQSKGSAQKEKVESYVYTGKENHHVRLVGDLLPRYLYWIKGENNKNLPLECLAFDRNTETFNNKETDHVPAYYPDLKCAWSYAIQCIDYSNDEPTIKIFNLKRKLFDQIMTASEDLGDPTDPTTGWDVYFKRLKTGPQVFNVEYQLQALKCKPRALDDNEQALIAELKSMDDVLPRPTADAQLELLKRVAEGEGSMNDDVSSEFDVE